MNERKILLGEELFNFTSFQQWVDKASSWFSGVRKFIVLDEKGRVLLTGAEFMRARDDNSFPVRVYSVVVSPKENLENAAEHPATTAGFNGQKIDD